MKRTAKISIITAIVLLASMLPTWNYSKQIAIPASSNPLWTENHQEIASSFTDDLKQQGYVFVTDRGAEAVPDGIGFGRFGSDEYWVIQYRSDRKEVEANAWIVGINWIGYLAAESRFSHLEKTLQKHLK